jgi:hypothetical protein
VACNGSSVVSPRFAAALWALDWALRAARRGVRQIEFHDQLGPCTGRTYSPVCAPGPQASAAGRFAAQPVLYGMLAAARLEGGSFLPVSLQASGSISAYATREPGGRVHVAIDNLSPAGPSQALIALLPARYRAAVEQLAAPAVTARRGVRLGGAQILPGGRLSASSAPLPGGAGFLRLRLAAGSAALITLTPAG